MSRADHHSKRFQAKLGDSWWWRRYADLVDRRPAGRAFDASAALQHQTRWQRYRHASQIKNGLVFNKRTPTRAPAVTSDYPPPVLPRPADMSRQAHRRLYREACKIAGVAYEPTYNTHGKMSKKHFRTAMKELAKYDNQTPPRSAR